MAERGPAGRCPACQARIVAHDRDMARRCLMYLAAPSGELALKRLRQIAALELERLGLPQAPGPLDATHFKSVRGR